MLIQLISETNDATSVDWCECASSHKVVKKLVENIIEFDDIFHGLTRKQVTKSAFDFVEINQN